MPLLRFFRTKAEIWLAKVPDPEPLLSATFEISRDLRADDVVDTVSVFDASDQFEEATTAGAYALANVLSAGIAPVYACRILESDLSHLRVVSVPGQTGVTSIDSKHRHLAGSKREFYQMVVGLLERIEQGEDRIRRFGARQLAFQLRSFARDCGTEITPNGRRLLDRYFEREAGGR